MIDVLIVGNGAREHALAWKISQSTLLGKLYVAPGNAGTRDLATNISIEVEDIDKLLSFALENNIDFTIVGPEIPLSLGLVDSFQEAGLSVFGPNKIASQMESSKVFSKNLMQKYDIPTAKSMIFSEYNDAIKYLASSKFPIVIKASGLAAGKGVFIVNSFNDGEKILDQLLRKKELGDAGGEIVVEEYLIGQEISVFAFVNEKYISELVAACDYKKAYDGDLGPNTGGMGAYSPPKLEYWNDDIKSEVLSKVMLPVVDAMVSEKIRYTGILYAGLILTDNGPMVLEFNCRLGDPEAQVVLPRLNGDFLNILMEIVKNQGSQSSLSWLEEECVGVVLTSEGYPEKYSKGYPIRGLEQQNKDIMVFHAGTVWDQVSEAIVTDGGRVLTLVAKGMDRGLVRDQVYSYVDKITFEGSTYRTDIGV